MWTLTTTNGTFFQLRGTFLNRVSKHVIESSFDVWSSHDFGIACQRTHVIPTLPPITSRNIVFFVLFHNILFHFLIIFPYFVIIFHFFIIFLFFIIFYFFIILFCFFILFFYPSSIIFFHPFFSFFCLFFFVCNIATSQSVHAHLHLNKVLLQQCNPCLGGFEVEQKGVPVLLQAPHLFLGGQIPLEAKRYKGGFCGCQTRLQPLTV